MFDVKTWQRLGSAAYLLIIYLKLSKFSPENRVYCVNVQDVSLQTIKAASISSCTPARLKLIVATASIQINTIHSKGRIDLKLIS